MEVASLFTKYRIKKGINSKWKILMERINNIDLGKDPTRNSNFSDFNKKANYYVIEKIIIKHYGFDAVVVMPYGKSLNDFRKLLPAISVIYRGKVIAEYSETKSSVYMRCHLEELEISEIDEIKFKWYAMFSDSKMRNMNGETFVLKKSEKIYHPIKKDKNGNKALIGYRFKISIPLGLSYDLLESSIVDLNKLFGICCLHFDDKENTTTIEIMTTKLPDDEKFEPIKVKPWELYCGMTHYYKPIILDFKTNPNWLVGGKAGSGKTISITQGVTNTILYNDETKVNLYIILLSSKQDFRAFRNTKHCKYYANTIKEALKELLYLSKEVARRNRLFEEYDEIGSIVNIYEYNKVAKNKLPIVYLMVDEIASFSVNGSEEKGEITKMKKRCDALLWEINREGRSAGVYCLLSSQRSSVCNLNPEVKANLGNVSCFRLPNLASAMTVVSDGELSKLVVKLPPQREFICEADELYFGKTLFLDMKMVVDFLKPLIDTNKEFMNLDTNGCILKYQEKTSDIDENATKTTEKEQEIKENKRKVIDFTKKIEPVKREKENQSRWEEYQERRKDRND